jgi:hypothetical protein
MPRWWTDFQNILIGIKKGVRVGDVLYGANKTFDSIYQPISTFIQWHESHAVPVAPDEI